MLKLQVTSILLKLSLFRNVITVFRLICDVELLLLFFLLLLCNFSRVIHISAH